MTLQVILIKYDSYLSNHLFNMFMAMMVSVNFGFLKKIAQNGQFSLEKAIEAYNVIFRISSHRHFCLEFNKESKKYMFFNFFQFFFFGEKIN